MSNPNEATQAQPPSTRFDYVQYDEKAASLQQSVKSHCVVLELFLNNLPESRGKALALTKLEEFYMWTGKAIRDDQIKRNGSAPSQEQRSNS